MDDNSWEERLDRLKKNVDKYVSSFILYKISEKQSRQAAQPQPDVSMIGFLNIYPKLFCRP